MWVLQYSRQCVKIYFNFKCHTFLLDLLQGLSLQVEILSICLSVCLFVCPLSLQLLFLFLQTLSSRNLSQSTSVTQPLPRYPMSPIHVSHARQSTGPPSQSTGPPMNRIISQTFLFPFGVELCVSLTFLKERTDFNCKQSINRSKHGHIFQKLNKVKAGNNFDQKSISYRFGCQKQETGFYWLHWLVFLFSTDPLSFENNSRTC